jgi:hypothetical protein
MRTNRTFPNHWNPKKTHKKSTAKHPGRDVSNGVQRVPVPCPGTPAEGKGMSCPASWVTLQDLVCNGENIRRKCMDHTVDPGRESQEPGLGR